MYARRHLTTAVTAVVRSVGNRASVRRPVLNNAAIAVATAQSAWLLRNMDSTRLGDERVAWADAAAGSVTMLLGATGLSQTTWNRGMAWPSQHTFWCAAGMGMLGDRRSRAARLALMMAPVFLPRANRQALRQIGSGVATGLVGAGCIGVFLSRQLERTSAEIDHLIDQTTETQSSTVRQRVNSEIELNVVASTVGALQELRVLLAHDRAAAALHASEAVERLTAWFGEEPGLHGLVHERTTAAKLATRTDAGERLDRAVRLFDAALRLIVLVSMVFEVRRCRRSFGPAPSETTVAVLATAHFLLAVGLLSNGSTRAKTVLSGTDVVMNLVSCALEPLAGDGSGRPQWSMGYSVGLASAAGVTAAGTGPAPVAPWLMGATRAAFELSRSDGSALSRAMRAFDESMMLVDVAAVSQQTSDLTIDQARAISARAAELTEARALEESARARRGHEHFLHDSALQVFLWATKSDLSDDELIAWCDREMLALEDLLAGRSPSLVTDLGRAVGDLLRGFSMFGLEPVLVVEASVYDREYDPAVALCVVTVLNEALTNVLKHSDDRAPRIDVERGPDLVCRVVNTTTNNWRQSTPGAQLGLRAAKERALVAGGTVTTTDRNGHFELELVLPVDQEPTDGNRG